MDLKAFYDALGDWVISVNQASQSMNQDEYWEFILTTAGELSNKYENRPLVKKVILAHIDFLEDAGKGSN